VVATAEVPFVVDDDRDRWRTGPETTVVGCQLVTN
jgi:hypothetical protein